MSAPPDLVGRIDAVVVGSSAGGVDALTALLPMLPAGFPAAVLVVQHLPRDRPSMLVDILSSRCALPVGEAEDKQPIEGGTITIAPPDYHLLVEAGPALALSADEPVNFSRPSIDVLFESAADVYGERLLGLVLTGASRDGTAGLRAVHRAGGVAAVQRPDTAEVRLMVESALEATPSATALPLDALGRWLATLAARAAGSDGR